MSIPFTPANFGPTMLGYTGQQPFRFWCQKVLPLVYDDSLSYYELLNKVVDYLNNTISDVANVETNVDSLNTSFGSLQSFVNDNVGDTIEAFNTLESFVNDYFTNLDVQEEINVKLDAMAANGTLTQLLIDTGVIPDAVSAWLEDNLTPTSPPVDNTLSIANAAADAKATGDSIASTLDSSLHRLTSTEITNLTSFADMPKGCYFSATKSKIETLNGGSFPFTLSNVTHMVVSYRYAGTSQKAGIIEIFTASKGAHFIGYILSSGSSVTWYDRNANVKTLDTTVTAMGEDVDELQTGLTDITNLSLRRLTSDEYSAITSFTEMPKGRYFSCTKAKIESLNGGEFPFTLSNITYMVVSYRYNGSADKAGIIEIFSGSKALHFIGYVLSGSDSVSWYDRNANVKTLETQVDALENLATFAEGSNKVRILFYGSSFEYSTMGLLPAVFSDIAPYIDLTIGLCYYSGANMADHISLWDGNNKYTEYSEYNSQTNAWTNTANTYTGKEAFDLHDWDYIAIHEGVNAANYDNVETFLDTITQYSDHAISFIYNTVQANGKNGNFNETYTQATGKEKSDEMFRRITVMAQELLEDYPQISFVLPGATAVQNARTTDLSELGTYGDLCYDSNSHLQNGLPTLIPAYAIAYKLCEIVGIKPKIFAIPVSPTDSWLNTYNLYTKNSHGSCVGVTLANKILAQKCALMAIKNPYTITDMS